MKKTQFKDAVRNIFKRRIAYASVLLTIVVGVAGLLCIFYVGESFDKGASEYYIGSNFMDIELVSTSGFSDENVDTISRIDKITDTEGIYGVSAIMSDKNKAVSVDVVSLTEKINIPTLCDGSMPVSADECLIDRALSERTGISVGDTVKLHIGSSDLSGFLRSEEFKITGTMIHPDKTNYSEASGVVVLKSAFDTDKTRGGFTSVIAKLDIDGKVDILSDRYTELVSDVISEIRPELDNIAEVRTAQIRKELDDEYNKAKVETDEKLSDAQKQLDDAEKEVRDEIADAEKKIADSRKQAEDGLAELEKTKEENQAKIDLASSLGMDMSEAQKELDTKISEARKKLDDAFTEIEKAQKELDDKKEEAETKLAEKRSEFDDKKAEAEEKLSDAKAKIDDLDDCRIIIKDRRMNASFEEIRASVRSINSIGGFFSPLFAVVGSIVFFSTVAIIIDEQKKQVGTVKALGFRSGTIRSKYLLFGVSAAMIGCIFGIILSVMLEGKLLSTLEHRYSFGSLPTVMSPVTALILCVTTVVTVYFVVWAACRKLLGCSAVGLISGSEPPQRSLTKSKKKERKRSLYSELILNNVKTDLSRVIVGITVIATCGLLIGAGITMREGFFYAFYAQENIVSKFDLKVKICEDIPENARQDIMTVIADSGAQYAEAYSGGTLFEAGDGGYGTSLLVMEKDRIGTFYDIGEPTDTGVTVSQNLSAAYGLGPGAEFSLYSLKFNKRPVKVSGTFNYHTGSLICISSDSYKETFGEECNNNCCFVKYDGADKDALIAKLTDPSASYFGYISLGTALEQAEKVESVKNLFDIVAVIFISLATVLDFLIVTNLTNILVNRRMKELLIMRVNGFSMKQVIGYLARESLFTTSIGIVLSVAAGIPFSQLLMRAVSSTSLSPSDSISVPAWIVSVLLSTVFAVVINAIAFRKVTKSSLLDITEY